jgi:hypothetical protein
MTDYTRYYPKSGSDWTTSDLVAYNISVSSQTPDKFYGQSLPTIASLSSSLDPNLLSGTLDTDGLSDETYRLLQYIDLASGANLGQMTVVDDFVREILRALGYEKRDLLFRSRYAIPLSNYGIPICGSLPQTSVSLVHSSSIILLVVQEVKTVAGISNPEPQIIREAIANFQWNNRIRVQLGEYELDSMTFPCIAMTGTRPIFYLVPVTRDLSEAVAASKYTSSPTVVQRCVVTSNRLSEGMETPNFRQLALQHFTAFRTLAETHWSAFMIPEFPVETRKED